MMDFAKVIESLKDTGFKPIAERVQINVPNAREVLSAGIRHYMGESARWLPAYDEVAEWMTDNKGKGLLCRGGCGLGKTLICAQLLPLILNHYCRKIVPVYRASEIGKRADEVLSRHILVIDDAGMESPANDYGVKRDIFSELVYKAELDGKLLIITTNLPYKGGSVNIQDRYGVRTVSRLHGLVKTVTFRGEDMRI